MSAAKKKPRPRRRICRNGDCRVTREHYRAALDRIDELRTDHEVQIRSLREKLSKAITNNDALSAALAERGNRSDLEILLDRSFKELEGLIEMKRFHEANP